MKQIIPDPPRFDLRSILAGMAASWMLLTLLFFIFRTIRGG